MKRGAAQLAAGAVLFVVGAVLVGWLVGGPADSLNFERPGPNEASGESDAAEPQQPALAGATVDDGTWGLAPGESKREAAPASAGTRIAARLSELLSPRRAGSRDALVDYRVAMIASDGTRRDVRPDDPVDVSDIVSGGLWIIEADGLCARWLASGEVPKWLSLGHEEPLALELSPQATVVVHVEATPPGRVPIEAIELTAESVDDEYFPGPDGNFVRVTPATRQERLAVFAGLRDLLEPTLTRDRRRAVLAALFAHPELLRNVDAQSPTAAGVLAPWCERHSARPVADVTFTNVPAIAAVEVVVACSDTLEFDAHMRRDHPTHALLGRLRSALLPLAPGATVEIGIFYVPFGRVTGRLPDDAHLPAKFTLLHRFRARTDSGVADHRALASDPRIDDERTFTWPALPPGNYVINAEWRGPGSNQNFVEREFDVVAGETVDLGVLFAPLEGALTILPRFVNEDGTPFVSPLLPGRVLVSRGSIYIDPGGPWVAVQSIPLEFENGVPTVVRGLDPADYFVQGGELVERDADASPLSRATGTQHCELFPRPVGRVKVSLPAQQFVELEVAVREIGVAVVELVVDAEVARSDLFVTYHFVSGAAGGDLASGGLFEVRPGPEGTTLVSIDLSPVFGEWIGYVIVGVEDGESKEWLAARGNFVVERGVDTRVQWRLEPTATVRLREARLLEPRHSRGTRAIVLADVEAPGQVGNPQYQTKSDGYVVYGGLVPNTDYMVLGEQRVTTGAPGSVVDVP